jgi:WD40 repeat protein
LITLKKFYLLTILLVLLAACGPVTPVANPTLTATMKPKAGIIPTTSPPNTESSFTEPLTTENIDRMEQVARFGNGYIQGVAVSPDQSILAVYVGEKIDIYDTETFTLKQSIVARKYSKASSDIYRGDWKILTFTSDSKQLVFSDGKIIIFWNVVENKQVKSFTSLIPEWDVVDISLSPNEDRVMLTTLGSSRRCDGRDMNFALYDLDGRLIFDHYTCPDYSNNFYRFTNDGKVMLIFASIMTGIYPTQTVLMDGMSGEVLEQTQAEYLDYEQPVPNLELLYDISPDGKFLAYATYNRSDDNLNVRTKIVRLDTKNVIHEQDGLVEFFVDQGRVSWQATSRDKPPTNTALEVCNINSSHQVDTYKLLLSQTEKAVFAVMHSGHIESIELWSTSNCQIENAISYPAATRALFSADGQWLASTDGYHAYIWEVQTEKLHFMVPGQAFDNPKNVIQFNADGSRFLASSRGLENVYPDQPYRNYTISVFDTRSGQLVRELRSDSDFLKNIVATPEKDLVIIQDSTNQHVWNIETGQKLATLPAGPFVFAPQPGDVWITPRQQNNLQTLHQIILFNYHTGEQVQELDQISTYWISNIYLDSTGTKLLAHLFLGQGKENGDAVIIFDTANAGKELFSYKLPWLNYEMSAYGDYFVTNDADGYVHLWNYESNLPTLTLWGNHRNWNVSDQYKDAEDKNDIYAMLANTNWIDRLFVDESILITKGTPLRFWDTKSGYLLAEMKPDYSIDSLSISPDRALIVVVGKDGIIRLWGVPNKP